MSLCFPDCKKTIAHHIHNHARHRNYKNVRYITYENDFRTKLTVF
ncbi:DUF2691 family protein [Saccharibacillus sacchari]|uniref:DUF2691 family protein n=1 Tax=Saccharibacillus sacchari TaxID=456493 RepID=A0ACC6P733_9BACL